MRGRHAAPHGIDRRQIIFDIMLAGDSDLVSGHDDGILAVGGVDDLPVGRQKAAALDAPAAREGRHRAGTFSGKAARDVVIGIEDGAVARPLPEHEVHLRVDILLHIGVPIQMVGRDVRHHRHLRRLPHPRQLEAGQFHDGGILRADLLHIRQQRAPDVPADEGAHACGIQQPGDDRGGGGLAVGAGHGVDRRLAQVEEQLHLGRDAQPARPRLFELRQVRLHARRAQDQVAVQPVKVAVAQRQHRTGTAQFVGDLAQLLRRAAVARRDVRARLEELADHRDIVVADAADRDRPAGNGRKKLAGSAHILHSRIALYFYIIQSDGKNIKCHPPISDEKRAEILTFYKFRALDIAAGAINGYNTNHSKE